MQEKNKLRVVNLMPSCWEYAIAPSTNVKLYTHDSCINPSFAAPIVASVPLHSKNIRSNQTMARVVDNSYSSQDTFRNLDVLISYLYKMTHNLNQKITINQPSQDLVNCSNTSSWPTRNFPWPSIPSTRRPALGPPQPRCRELRPHRCGSCGLHG